MIFKPALAIRVDANPQIGNGHIIRCFALAQMWIQQGGTVYFISTVTNPALQKMILDSSAKIQSISAEPGSFEDAQATSKFSHSVKAQWLVVDGYNFNEVFQKEVYSSGIRTFIIDDYRHSPEYYADVILNQNVYANKKMYKACGTVNKLLLGPKYALIRQEFLQLKQKDNNSNKSQEKKRILVTFGGSDPDNITKKVIDALNTPEFENFEINVIISPTNSHYLDFKLLSKNHDSNFRFFFNPKNIAELMANSDLAISGAGSTTMELALLQVPMVLIVIAENQQKVADALRRKECAISLGGKNQVNQEKIRKSIKILLEYPSEREKITKRAGKLVDGNGSKRVVTTLSKGIFSLRTWEFSDCKRIWLWANEPETRKNSFSPSTISWEEHCAWFKNRFCYDNYKGFMIIDNKGVAQGSIRFDLEGHEATISIMIAMKSRKRGIGRAAISRASADLFASTNITSINAFIRAENEISIRTFSRAGFIHAGRLTIQGSKAVFMKLSKKP
jgi:UDP-2,4-diacetamido-2,4,6-trideoxy-beta-L-altropyranose hydrolase